MSSSSRKLIGVACVLFLAAGGVLGVDLASEPQRRTIITIMPIPTPAACSALPFHETDSITTTGRSGSGIAIPSSLTMTRGPQIPRLDTQSGETQRPQIRTYWNATSIPSPPIDGSHTGSSGTLLGTATVSSLHDPSGSQRLHTITPFTGNGKRSRPGYRLMVGHIIAGALMEYVLDLG